MNSKYSSWIFTCKTEGGKLTNKLFEDRAIDTWFARLVRDPLLHKRIFVASNVIIRKRKYFLA